MTLEDKVKRPVKHLSAISQRYAGIWKLVDLLRANREQIQQKHQWPSWCYLPLGGAAGILGPPPPTERDRENVLKIEASRIAMLASWRHAKDIYIFDETVLEELWETPVDGDIPIEILHKLPTWCAYVALPPRDVEGATAVHGFFVHLNYSGIMPVLMLMLDYGPVDHIGPNSMLPFFVELHEGHGLLQCLTVVHERALAKNGKPSPALEARVQPESVMRWVEPLLSLTIYLCSASAEIRARDPLRGLRGAYVKKTRKGVRTFVPEEPQVWEVAFRIGATLRAAKAAVSQPGVDQGGAHRSPRPHIRRAHWHSYWTGQKAAVGKPPAPAREVVVKWIPPIPIAMGLGDETIPVVHRVTK